MDASSRTMKSLQDFLLKYNVKVVGMKNSFGHGISGLVERWSQLSRKGVPGV